MKYVIGLGGSVICPDEINKEYLKRFKKFIEREIKKGRKFVIVAGGGKTARKYQKAAPKDLDLIGIAATKLNAELLKSFFNRVNPVVFDERFKIKSLKYPVSVGSGWDPGWSTDYVAVHIAIDLKINKVIFVGKPDYVYTADFVKNKKARPVKDMQWKDYFKLIPSHWTPGLSAPVDPVAARLACRNKVKVVVAGKNLNNLKKILNNQPFKGTTLHD